MGDHVGVYRVMHQQDRQTTTPHNGTILTNHSEREKSDHKEHISMTRLYKVPAQEDQTVVTGVTTVTFGGY